MISILLQTSWNSGETIVNLVQKLGCTIPDMSNTKPEVRCATGKLEMRLVEKLRPIPTRQFLGKIG